MSETIPDPWKGLGGRLRRELDRQGWGQEHFGPDGRRFWHVESLTHVIVTRSDVSEDPALWVHASISHPNRTPTYEELAGLHRAVYGDRYAYQVFPPRDAHVNIHAHALHLWGRWDDGDGRVLPDFAGDGEAIVGVPTI